MPPALRTVDLGGCDMSSVGAIAIADALVTSAAAGRPPIRVNCPNNRIGLGGQATLLRALEGMRLFPEV